LFGGRGGPAAPIPGTSALTGAPSNITGIAATIEVGGGGGSHGGGYGGGGGTGGGGGSEGDEKKRASSCLVKVVLQWSPGKKEKYSIT
jgi:hypothetical protein